MTDLTHLDRSGAARMVDAAGKPETARTARAGAIVRMLPSTALTVEEGNGPKGDVISVARLAGIQAAKRTGELIPLAHPLPLTHVDVEIRLDSDDGTATITAEAGVVGRTGVEMEAMVACTTAALTIYDMVKAIDRDAVIDQVRLLEKAGGKSGHWQRED